MLQRIKIEDQEITIDLDSQFDDDEGESLGRGKFQFQHTVTVVEKLDFYSSLVEINGRTGQFLMDEVHTNHSMNSDWLTTRRFYAIH